MVHHLIFQLARSDCWWRIDIRGSKADAGRPVRGLCRNLAERQRRFRVGREQQRSEMVLKPEYTELLKDLRVVKGDSEFLSEHLENGVAVS